MFPRYIYYNIIILHFALYYNYCIVLYCIVFNNNNNNNNNNIIIMQKKIIYKSNIDFSFMNYCFNVPLRYCGECKDFYYNFMVYHQTMMFLQISLPHPQLVVNIHVRLAYQNKNATECFFLF